jgi:hypothetical protein
MQKTSAHGVATPRPEGLNSAKPYPALDPYEKGNFRIAQAEIIDTVRSANGNAVTYSYRVRLYDGTKIDNVELVSALFDYSTASGAYGVAKKGTHCLVAILGESHPMDGGAKRAFILGFVGPLDDTGNFRGIRHNIQPGSYGIFNDTQGGLFVSVGGFIRNLASAACTRFYVGLEDIISDICQNYTLDCGGGRMEWLKDVESGSSYLQLRIWKNANFRQDDTKPHVDVIIGDVFGSKKASGATSTEIIKVRVFNTASTPTLTLTILDDGSYTLDNGNEISVKSDGEIKITAKSGTTIEIDTDGNVEIDVGAEDIDLKGTGVATVDFPRVNIGDGTGGGYKKVARIGDKDDNGDTIVDSGSPTTTTQVYAS